MLFELADEIVELPATEWSEETRVRGCQSEAHVRVRVEEGLVVFVQLQQTPSWFRV